MHRRGFFLSYQKSEKTLCVLEVSMYNSKIQNMSLKEKKLFNSNFWVKYIEHNPVKEHEHLFFPF